MNKTPLIIIILACLIQISFQQPPNQVPVQYFYNEQTLNEEIRDLGLKNTCIQRNWEGTDQYGTAGFPWFSTINCQSDQFEVEGVLLNGHIKLFVHDGEIQLTYQNKTSTLTYSSSTLWINQGAYVKLVIKGFVSIVGAKFQLNKNVEAPVFTASYDSLSVRAYLPEEAVKGKNYGKVGHDEHIKNGTANAWDITYSTITKVDQPNIIVINCEESSYVDFHSHQQGAIYIPFTGKLCFQTTHKQCVVPGEARWTSPNLYYYEPFEQIQETSEAANELVDLVVPSFYAKQCQYPITFAVTNFDPDNGDGQPNFTDIPENAVWGQKWGFFKQVIARATYFYSMQVEIDPNMETRIKKEL